MSADIRRVVTRLAIAAFAGGALLLPTSAAFAGGSDTAGPITPPAITPDVAARESQLVATEDNRLHTLLATMNHKSGKHAPSGPQIQNQGLTLTLILPRSTTPYTLADLVTAAPNLLQTLPDGSILITGNILVAPGAHLVIGDSKPITLRLASDATGFVSIVAWDAQLDFAGTATAPITITSWDRRQGAVATDPSLGRGYVRDAGGIMNVSHVTATDLGFWSGRTGGFAWTGTDKNPSSGTVTDSNFSGSQYGIFASRTQNLQVYRCNFTANYVTGYAQHRLSSGNVTRDSFSSRNAVDGFSVDRGSGDATFTNDVATYNGHDGFYLDGRALATGASASGVSLDNYGRDTVTKSWSSNNGAVGILIAGGYNQQVTHTQVDSNQDGIVIRGAADSFVISDDQLIGNGRFGVAITDGGTNGAVTNNVIDGAFSGVLVRNAVAAVTDNNISDVRMHGVSMQGNDGHTVVAYDNVSGHGLTAIDYRRVVSPGQLTMMGNNTDNWVQLHRIYPWYHIFQQHPLLVLWGFILLIPITIGVILRRRQILHPYHHTTRWQPQAGALGPQVHPADGERQDLGVEIPAVVRDISRPSGPNRIVVIPDSGGGEVSPRAIPEPVYAAERKGRSKADDVGVLVAEK